MKTGKLITFNILAFITSLFVAYLYFGGGTQAFSLTSGYLASVAQPFILITVLFVTSLLTNLSYLATYAKSKKNLLRISLILISLLTLVSIIIRIIQAIKGNISAILILGTIFYIILLVLNIMMLKDLHRLIRKLFNDEVYENY